MGYIVQCYVILHDISRENNMYTFVRSWLNPVSPELPYHNVDLRNVTVATLLDEYIDGYIELTHTALKGSVFVDLQTIRESDLPMNTSLKFSTWINTLGNRRIPTMSSKPVYETNRVYYRDAVLCDCKIDVTVPYRLPNDDAAISDKTNVYVEYPPKYRSPLNHRVITTVNGMGHLNFPFEKGIQIVDGGRSSLRRGDLSVGILSFENVAELVQIPITEDIMSKITPATPYKEGFLLDLNMDLSSHSFVLSIGGYLHFNPKFLKVISPETGVVRVDLGLIDVPLCINKSKHLIDLAPLGVHDTSDTNDESYGLLRVQDVYSDIVMKKWLTLPQSFIVVVNTPNLTVSTKQAHWTGLYGVYEYHENPTMPLLDHYGRLPEYWVKKQNGVWVLLVEDTLYKEHTHALADETEKQFVNEAMPYHSEHQYPMSFLEISTTVKK